MKVDTDRLRSLGKWLIGSRNTYSRMEGHLCNAAADEIDLLRLRIAQHEVMAANAQRTIIRLNAEVVRTKQAGA